VLSGCLAYAINVFTQFILNGNMKTERRWMMNQPVHLTSDRLSASVSSKLQNLCREYRDLWHLARADPHRLDDLEDPSGQRLYTRLQQCEEKLLQQYDGKVVVAMRK
jgi:hypothetical protein